MYKKLTLIALIILSFSSCENTKKDTITSTTATEELEVGHQFAPGESIFWSSKFEADKIIFTVELAPTWMTYSQYNSNFIGPLPTIFTFEESDNYELIGSVDESLVKMKYDNEAKEELTYFEGKGKFTQKIKIKTGEKFVLKGNINFMTCNNHGCEPPADHPFEIEITP